MIMFRLALALPIVFGPRLASMHADIWNPGPGRMQINLWPGKIPNALGNSAPESTFIVTDKLVGGKPWTVVRDVSIPTLTVYKAKQNPSGTAIIVYPGGGYNLLAIDLEGSEICEWLNTVGITAILVKYRVPTPKAGAYGESLQALQDAQRAISLARSRSKEFEINPRKVGVIGFSAGGHLVAAVSTNFAKRSYPKQDVNDEVSCRPDFAVALYPGHIFSANEGSNPSQQTLPINPNLKVSQATPPTFIVQAQDDKTDDPRNSLAYYLALQRAKIPAELHLFSQGGHAFGLRKGNLPIGTWPTLMVSWLRQQKFI